MHPISVVPSRPLEEFLFSFAMPRCPCHAAKTESPAVQVCINNLGLILAVPINRMKPNLTMFYDGENAGMKEFRCPQVADGI